MFELLAEQETGAGSKRLRLARLLEPLDAINALVRQRLTGVECRNWMELDKWADQSYNWYVAGRALRRSPEVWRDAAASRHDLRPAGGDPRVQRW